MFAHVSNYHEYCFTPHLFQNHSIHFERAQEAKVDPELKKTGKRKAEGKKSKEGKRVI